MATLISPSPIPPDPGSRSSSRRYMVSPALSDQQSQLDDIIGDLLSDKAFMTDHGEINPLDMNGIVMPQHGSITTQTGNSRTVLSWQTHQSGPNRRSPSASRPGSRAGSRPASRASSRPSSRARVESDSTREQSSSVQKLPGGGISSTSSKYEEDRWATKDGYQHYRSSEETRKFEETRSSGLDKEISIGSRMTSGVPQGGSKTPPPPPVRRHVFSPDQLGGDELSRRYNPDILSKRSVSESRQYASDTEDPLAASWLEGQKTKLYEKRDSRTESEQLMSRSSGYSSINRSYMAQSDTEDKHDRPAPARPPPPISSYDSLDELSNLLTESARDLTTTSSSSLHQQQQKHQKSMKHYQVQQARSSSVGPPLRSDQGKDSEPVFFVSGLEKPAFSRQQTKYVFSVSPSPTSMIRDDSLEDKFNRSSCLSPPPPKRGDSSKQAVQRRNEPIRSAPSVDELDAALAKILADSKPEPETERMIEEEIISLEPIGRGIHTLEPDLETLSRNRSRAVSPVYPGFPQPGYRSPSLGRMQGGGVSPTPSRARSVTPRTLSPAPLPSEPVTSSQRTVTSHVSESKSSSSVRAGESMAEVIKQEQRPFSSVTKGQASGPQAGRTGTDSRGPSRLEEELEQAVNSMIQQTEPFKKPAMQQKQTTPLANSVVEEPVLQAAVSSRAQQLQKVPEQLSTLTRTTITRTHTHPTAAATGSYSDLRTTSPGVANQQQQQQQKSSYSSEQLSQAYSEQQQNLLKHKQQLEQLEQQQKALREKQLQLQREQQELLQQQRQQQQQQQLAGTGGKWIIKEETVTRNYTNSGGQATGGQSVGTGSGVAVNTISSTTGQQQQKLHLQQQRKQEEIDDLEQQMLEIEKQMQQQQQSSSVTQSSSKQQFTASSLQQNVGAQNSSGQQQSSTVQQLNDLSEKLQQLQKQQEEGEPQYSSVSHQQRQQAVSSKYSAATQQSSSLAASGSSYGVQSGGQQQNKSSSLVSGGDYSVQSALSSRTMSHQHHHHQQEDESSQERHYATVPSRELRKAAALQVEASGESQSTNTLARSPSPSLWTNEALRSYTDRKHSGSVSPLLQPGHTLPLQGRASPYFGQSMAGSVSSMTDMDTLNHIPKFVRDSSRLWHRPNITREEAISMLRDKPAGSFIIRNSSTFQGAYGLALKVSQVPPNVQSRGGDPQTELVRHFLIETTSKGVRLKGCSNEPVFASLAALVYQHTITPLALPCKLLLPQDTEVKFVDVTDSNTGVLNHGAACNVLYLNSMDTESLTGAEALSKTIRATFRDNKQPKTTLVEFKVSTQGVTLTDNQRSLFFRRHYPMNTVTYCGIDEGERRWNPSNEQSSVSVGGRVFGFVARKAGSLTENACHIFVESDPSQPASAIVDYITKIMIRQGQSMKI